MNQKINFEALETSFNVLKIGFDALKKNFEAFMIGSRQVTKRPSCGSSRPQGGRTTHRPPSPPGEPP